MSQHSGAKLRRRAAADADAGKLTDTKSGILLVGIAVVAYAASAGIRLNPSL